MAAQRTSIWKKGKKEKERGGWRNRRREETPLSSSYEPKVSPQRREPEGWVTHHAQNHNIQIAPSCTQKVLATMKTVELRGDHLQEPAHDNTGSSELQLDNMI